MISSTSNYAIIDKGDKILYLKKKKDNFDSENLIKGLIAIQTAIGDILQKHCGGLLEPTKIDENTISINNLRLKNGIKYFELDIYYPVLWEVLSRKVMEKSINVIETLDKEMTMDMLLLTVWGDKEIKEDLDRLLTKIENGNSN